MSTITSFCLPIVSILLLTLQASTARHLGVDFRNKDPAQDHKRLLLDYLSDKSEDGTKQVKDHSPSKENVTLSREQHKGSGTPHESDQASNIVQDDIKEEQLTHVAGLKSKGTAKHGKMVKSHVDSSSGANPSVSVSWQLPHQQQMKRKRKKKKRGMSHDPEYTLDYAPPRVHPPCHN